MVVGKVSYGAMLGFTVAGINIQPSELVKIVFVFFVASSFKRSTEFKDIVVTTAVAAFHVLILVASKDLGAALIIFVVYLVMLYVATHQPLYILAGLGAGSAGAVVAYHLFTHVKTRVNVWRDPFGTYDKGGYQVAQSLFAIGTGGWFGAGLYQDSRTRFRYRQRTSSFCNFRRDGADLCDVSDTDLCELLCDVFKHCSGTPQSVLQTGSTGTWNLLYFPGIFKYRRSDKIYPFYGRNSSSCQLRRKLNFKYDDHVRHHTGSVYFKRR